MLLEITSGGGVIVHHFEAGPVKCLRFIDVEVVENGLELVEIGCSAPGIGSILIFDELNKANLDSPE